MKRGETILEVVIAVFLFMMIMGPASALYISSVQNIAMNRDALQAAALANSGIEIIRQMRDTNFLRFSQKARECWNAKPTYAEFSTCHESANKISEEFIGMQRFRLTQNPDTLEYDLNVSSAALSDPLEGIAASGDIEEYRLRKDTATPVNPECTGPGVPPDCDFHTALFFIPPTASAFASRGEASPFYHEIRIEYFDENGDSVAEPEMRVTSLAQYRVGAQLKNVKRLLRLTNISLL